MILIMMVIYAIQSKQNNNYFSIISRFLRALLPGDHPILRTEVSQRPILNIKEDERLSDEIEYTLAKLIKELII